jgi:hypothetical protein
VGQQIFKMALFTWILWSSVGCSFFDSFLKGKSPKRQDASAQLELGAVIGESLGPKAYGPDEAELNNLYAITTSHSPAPIRPDADVHFRRLLLQFRSEGTQVARLIGEIEAYRDLLGGANQDFSKKPLEDYDATSLLAIMKASELVCEALVAPTPEKHGNWETILPHDASQVTPNITFLYQRFSGNLSASLTSDDLASLTGIFKSWSPSGIYDAGRYIPVCVALSVDGEVLFL